jgi:hypothetical protein
MSAVSQRQLACARWHARYDFPFDVRRDHRSLLLPSISGNAIERGAENGVDPQPWASRSKARE